MRSLTGYNTDTGNGAFQPGQPITASALNALATSADKTRTMPSNDFVFNIGTGGTAYSLPQQVYYGTGVPASDYYNQFKCIVTKEAAEGGGFGYYLQTVNGSVVYGDENQAAQEVISNFFSGSPGVTIVNGGDPNSFFTDDNGYAILTPLKNYGVYLIHFQSNDSVKFKTYLYVTDTDVFNYPSTNFVATASTDVPDGIDAPYTSYTMKVMEIAFLTYNTETEEFSVNQELIGTQSIPTVEKPLQYQVEVINQNPDVETDPVWTLRVAKGIVMSAPAVSTDCISVDWIDQIANGCEPFTGTYVDSPYCNNGGGIYDISNVDEYNVYLFSITTDVDKYYKLWVGTSDQYTDECPVVLPANIAPAAGAPYTAQAIHIAKATQPHTGADVWVVEQIIQGTITFPNYVRPVCVPFKVHVDNVTSGVTSWAVCSGMVNNITPSNIDELFVFDSTGFLVINCENVNGESFPHSVTIEFYATLPENTPDNGYIVIAEITSVYPDEVTQIVGGSLWSDRIQIGAGETQTAYYYFAGI